MNSDDEQNVLLEARLQKLRPRPAPPKLLARLRANPPVVFAPPAAKPWLLRFPALWPAAAAAALVIFWFVLGHNPKPTPERAPARDASVAAAKPADNEAGRLRAEESADFVVGARKAGVWTSPEGRAYNVIQCLAVNRTVWKDTERGNEYEKLEPRQRVLLVAMDTQ